MARARIPQRDQTEEARLSIWFAWFSTRTVILATREFRIDNEDFCNEYFGDTTANRPYLESCVLVKEYTR